MYAWVCLCALQFVAELQSRDYNARRLDGKPEDRYATGRALAIELLMTLELMAVCNGVLRLRRFWKAYYNATKVSVACANEASL